MKISPAYASSFATLAMLFAASSVAGQERARFMVYHAKSQPTSTQPATDKQTSIVAQPRAAEPHVATTRTTTVKQAEANKQVTTVDKQITAAQVARVERRNAPAAVKTSYVATRAAAPAVTKNAMVTTATTVTTAASVATNTKTATEAVALKTPVAKASTVSPRMESPRATSARKPFDRWFLISSAVFAAGAVMDHQSTVAGMKKVGAREANPLLRNSDGGFSSGKHLALSAGMYGASLMLQKKHPRMANILRLVGGFAKIGVSIHNRRAASGRPDALPQ